MNTVLNVNTMMALRSRLRELFADHEPETFEEGAQQTVQLFRESLSDHNGASVLPLVRVFKTHRYAGLDRELKTFARNITPAADTVPDLRCLVLVATAGDEPAWNSRHQSQGHKAIPLVSEQTVAQAPMIARLIEQFGLPITTVLKPDPGFLIDTSDTIYNLFFVEHAAGSPYIVAQREFVVPYGIQSVIGFGGMLASGDLVAAILFSRLAINAETADLFKVIGLNFKLAMLRIAGKPLFIQGGT
jgi:hypothetical protein